MTESPGFLLTIAAFAGLIGPLIFLHELGHYLVGRLFGVKAEAFSIGFGRELVGWTDARGTRWKVAALPLGGYVRFAGDMNPASAPDLAWLSLPAEERAQTFQAKPVWQRFLIVAAGPAINFLFAILVFAGFFLTFGDYRTPPTVASVVSRSAAARAGIQPGDRVASVGGQAVDWFEDITPIVAIRPGEPLALDIDRGGRRLHLTATPDVDVQRDRFGNEFRRGLLGIASGAPVAVKLAPAEVPGAAIRHTGEVVRMMAATLWQVVTGRRSVRELGGPLKIAQYSGQQVTMGWLPFIEFMAMISINLGFINLLPIPLLDGGHLLFYLIEGARRRPVAPRVAEWAFRSGLALLLGFMLFVTVNDLGSLGVWARLARLIG